MLGFRRAGLARFMSLRGGRHYSMQIGPDEEDQRIMSAEKEAMRGDLVTKREQNTAPSTTGGRPIVLEDNTDEVVEANYALLLFEEEAQKARDELIAPRHPDDLVPSYARIKRSAKLKYMDDQDPDRVQPKELSVALPPPKAHPWVEGQPIGNHILHGDGQLGAWGSNNVGFEEGKTWRDIPRKWRGVNFQTTVGLTPSQMKGYVNQDTVVKHSLTLSGRGLFVTHDIKKGDLIMVVKSTATNMGFNSYTDRLVFMLRDILLDAHTRRDDPEVLDYLHTWIACGQKSARVEYFPRDATDRIIKLIGGRQVMDDLELHDHHIARIAATIEHNSFVVEGFYSEDKGKGYWPEAGLLNHSCIPNADYDVMSMDDFMLSDFNPRIAEFKAQKEAKAKGGDASAAAATEAASDKPAAEDHVHSEGCGCGDTHHSEQQHEGHRTTSASSPGAEAGSAEGAGATAGSHRPPDVSKLLRAFASGDKDSIGQAFSDYASARSSYKDDVVKNLPGLGVSVEHVGRDDHRNVRPSQDDVDRVVEAAEEGMELSTKLSPADEAMSAKARAIQTVVATLEPTTEDERAQAEADAAALLGYKTNDYVFACRANRDIAAGEEVLIAYVPPEWRTADREQVLYERYRFKCRCPKCVPAVENRSKAYPRMMMGILLVYFFLQIMVYAAQMDTLDMNEASERGDTLIHSPRFRT